MSFINTPAKRRVVVNNSVFISTINQEGQNTDYSIISAPKNGNLIPNDNHIIYTPNANYIGSDNFTYSTSSETRTITLTIDNYQNPIGIPTPWGVDKQRPQKPQNWTSTIPGWYYIDQYHPNATDSGNPNGFPGKPRYSIQFGTTVPPGSVIEIHGIYDYVSIGYIPITHYYFNGTEANPIWIVGENLLNRPEIQRLIFISGSYIILDNLILKKQTAGLSTGGIDITSGHHICVKNCDISGNTDTSSGAGSTSKGQVSTLGTSTNNCHNVTFWNNLLHDRGPWYDSSGATDWDVHGVTVGSYCNNIWIVDNEIFRCAGDAWQIRGISGSTITTHHVFCGRNITHRNGQTGGWTKESEYTVFSQNTCCNYVPRGTTSTGSGMGCQYGPNKLWIIFNHIYNAHNGISVQGGNITTPGAIYIIGNVIHDISTTEPRYNDPYTYGSALRILQQNPRIISGNTIANCEFGITNVNGNVEILNNIVANISGYHTWNVDEVGNKIGTLHHNLFYQENGTSSIKWLGVIKSVRELEQSFSSAVYQNIEANPNFIGPESYRLSSTSPAIDKAGLTPVYQEFFAQFGIDIDVDIEGTSVEKRDIGAFEFLREDNILNIEMVKDFLLVF